MEVPTIERQWFSYPEAERYSGLSRTTLWRIANYSGQLEVAYVGRAVRISRRSLEEYLERAAGKPNEYKGR